MSFALATYGFGARGGVGGGSDITPPVISPVSPLPGIAPGDPDGFPLDADLAAVTPIIVDITDVFPGVVFISVVNVTDGGAAVFRGSNFLGEYINGSSSPSITNGTELAMLPDGGWVGPFVQLDIDAIDAAGNYTSASLVWQLPVASAGGESSPVAETTTAVGAALDRLALQFRDGGLAEIASPFPAAAASAAVLGTAARLTAADRSVGFAGNADVLVVSFGAEAPSAEDLGWVPGVGRVTILFVSETTTWADAATALSTSTEMIGTASGTTPDLFPGDVASAVGLTAGLPAEWPPDLDMVGEDSSGWIALTGGRDVE